MDLTMVGQLVLNCNDKFVEMWSDNVLTGLTATWTKILVEEKS